MDMSKYRKFILISLVVSSIGVIMLLSSCNIKMISYDFWWHIKTGEWIVENNQIPTNDIFSWYGMRENLSWISHEWLSALLIYGMTFLFGIDLGGWLFVWICLLGLMTLLVMFNKKRYRNNCIFSFLWIILGIIIFSFVLSYK